MTSERGCKKDKNQNIQVFVRLRPLNQRERDIKSLGVIEVVNNREVVVRHSQQTTYTKKFTFDKAFAPSAKQFEVYQDVVSPLIEEVLNGYNCTVFAYGQTGTGKTHTMVGENTEGNTNWQNDPLAGVIPRALSQLFDELRISNTEYTVRVSYLELYNEELFDLLSTSEDNSKLRIYEDITRKGSNIVNGLEEITVYNKNEVYKIMAQGQERKKVASTLMNAQSSRSHTVFTIVVHMKENSQEGEELVKIGKLNLVDLAGSENISKAGSDNPAKRERARECVNINQSLLTLGRVITALVERHPHIPYRESKLTRILQESLGGRTKTSIIATISPGHKDLEETMSTLEYAHRAKNIQNKPEINQKMTKKAILKEYAEEIDKLKRDLQAARDKNGVYLANETFAELTLKQEEQRKEIQDLLLQKRYVEEERERMENIFKELSHKLEWTDRKLNITKNKLQTTKELLIDTKSLLQSRTAEAEEQRHLVAVHQRTEEELSAQAAALLQTADLASDHLARLHDTVETRRSLESRNVETHRTFLENAETLHDNRQTILKTFAESLATALHHLRTQTENHAITNDQIHKRTKDNIDDKIRKITDIMDEVRQLSKDSDVAVRAAGANAYDTLRTDVTAYGERLRVALERTMCAVAEAAGRPASLQLVATVDRFMRQWQTSSSERVMSLRSAHGAYASDAHEAYTALATNARRQRDARLERLDANSQRMQTRNQEMTSLKQWWDDHFEQATLSLKQERAEFSARLDRWVEEERRLFEARIQAHVSAETEAFNHRFEEKTQVMQKEKETLEKRMQCQMEMHQAELEAHRREIEAAERELEEWESRQNECDGHLDKYVTDLNQGMNAISSEIEAARDSIVQQVEELNNEIVVVLHQAMDHVEVEKREIMESECESEKRLVCEVETDRERIATETKRAVDSLLDNIQVNITATVEELSTVGSTMESLMTNTASHRHEQTTTLDSVKHNFEQFRAQTEEAEKRQAELQTSYLAKEFKVYSPTGGTPMRQELRYPRALVSTSPHERVLARYRQRLAEARQELECSVIDLDEDSEESVESSSVTSVYEDTASSPTSNGPPVPPPLPHSIVKSNSDMDIYDRLDGKENAERSTLNRKPSKLPSSCAFKRPLVQRNNSVN